MFPDNHHRIECSRLPCFLMARGLATGDLLGRCCRPECIYDILKTHSLTKLGDFPIGRLIRITVPT